MRGPLLAAVSWLLVVLIFDSCEGETGKRTRFRVLLQLLCKGKPMPGVVTHWYDYEDAVKRLFSLTTGGPNKGNEYMGTITAGKDGWVEGIIYGTDPFQNLVDIYFYVPTTSSEDHGGHSYVGTGQDTRYTSLDGKICGINVKNPFSPQLVLKSWKIDSISYGKVELSDVPKTATAYQWSQTGGWDDFEKKHPGTCDPSKTNAEGIQDCRN